MHLILRFTHVACLFMALQLAHAQNLTSGNLPVGSGLGQIGLEMALNEECHGPATITATSAGKLAVLDRVNGKIVIVGGATPVDIPLPTDFLEPTDFAATSVGYIVAGALGDIVVIDIAGKLVARNKTSYDPTAGSPRLISTSSGVFELEDLKGNRSSINISPAQTGTLIEPGFSKAGDYTQTPVKVGEVRIASKSMNGPLASILVKSQFRIAIARPIWVTEGKGALVAVQETRKLPVEISFVRLVNFDETGKPTTEAYLTPETFSCDANRAFTRLTDGTVVSLEIREKRQLTLKVLKFEPVGTAKPITALIGPTVTLIAAELDALKELEQSNGTSEASLISMNSISRETILSRARRALELKWNLTASAYGQADTLNQCNPPKNIWSRAKILEGRVGREITGIPYAWGSYMPELSNFVSKLENNYLASNVCTCRNANCVNKKAAGLDCSGFVSYAWKTGNYFTTASLPKSTISTPIAWESLKPGDIVNKRSSHVRLVESIVNSPNGKILTVIESTTLASCGGVCRKSYSQQDLETKGYKPFRRLSLTD